jgi:hypothetical protein
MYNDVFIFVSYFGCPTLLHFVEGVKVFSLEGGYN